MNGKQLKNSILQWAIQGKLVPQDPNDEPASVLLEKIRQEKERLIKEKKIKRDKNASIIYRGEDNSYYEKFLASGEVKCIDDEIPFEIPATWIWVRLNDICSYIQRGKSPIYSSIKKYPVIAQKCNQWAGFCIDKAQFIDPHSLSSYSEERLLQDGDLMWNSTGLGTLGRMAIYQSALNPYELAVADSHVTVIRPLKAHVLSQYLYYYFASDTVQSVIEDKSDGSTKQKELSTTTVKNYMVPLPSLAEQERIVEKVRVIMPVIDKYSKSQEHLNKINTELNESLKKSILQEAIQGKLVPQIAEEGTAQELLEQIRQEKLQLVKEGKLKKSALTDSVIFKGDDNKYYERIGKSEVEISDEIPFEIPSTWIWCRLKEVLMLNPRNSIDDNTEVGFIPMTNIHAGYQNRFEYTCRKWKDVKKGFTHLAEGDVAFAKITPCFQNRKSMIVKSVKNGFAAGTTELIVLRPYADTIEPKYLLWFCKSSYFIDDAKMKGTAGQQRVTVDYTPNKLIPLPPKDEQKRINSRIMELFNALQ